MMAVVVPPQAPAEVQATEQASTATVMALVSAFAVPLTVMTTSDDSTVPAAVTVTNRLAVSPGAGPAGLVPAVAVATGRPTDEVAGILFGPAPRDDAALIHLAQQLTDLEERAHHP